MRYWIGAGKGQYGADNRNVVIKGADITTRKQLTNVVKQVIATYVDYNAMQRGGHGDSEWAAVHEITVERLPKGKKKMGRDTKTHVIATLAEKDWGKPAGIVTALIKTIEADRAHETNGGADVLNAARNAYVRKVQKYLEENPGYETMIPKDVKALRALTQ